MKYRTPLLALVTAGSMLFAGTLLAQDQSMPPSSTPMSTMPASQSANTTTSSTQFNTAQGQVTIHSTVPQVNAGPAPSFEQLSGGSRYITEDQAAAYPLLANDFLSVDKGHTGHITKSQYERWVNNNR